MWWIKDCKPVPKNTVVEPNDVLQWDEVLNELLDKGEVKKLGACTLDFKRGTSVWIENYPYSFGYLYTDSFSKGSPMPTDKTKKKLKVFVDKLKYEQRQEAYQEILEKEIPTA